MTLTPSEFMFCLLKSLPSWNQGTLPRKFLRCDCGRTDRTSGRAEGGETATEAATAVCCAGTGTSVQRRSSVQVDPGFLAS